VGWSGYECGSGHVQVESSREHGKEHLGSVKCWKIVKWLHNWCPLE
jgi:hypothetical protein